MANDIEQSAAAGDAITACAEVCIKLLGKHFQK
jgi:hypothetical protein